MSTQNEFPLSRLFQNFLYVLFFMCRRLNAVQIKHFKIWLYINTIFGPKLISMKKKKNTFHYGGTAVELGKYQVRKFLRQIKSYHFKHRQEYSLKGKHILAV